MPDAWPLFDLRLRTERLELRSPTDADLVALVKVARAGVHDPSVMPFLVPWTDMPSPEFERSFMQFMWSARVSWTPEAWRLPMAVVYQGEPIGIQEIAAKRFSVRRMVETGSWLGRASQGRGIGTEMRAAVLHLAFAGLDATAAESGVLAGNEVSRRVSATLGYQPNGVGVVAPRGLPVQQTQYLLRREDWRPDRYPTSIEGLAVCLAMFGVGPR